MLTMTSVPTKRLSCFALLSFLASESVVNGQDSPCADPLAAVLATLKCVEDENVTCASAGYNSAEFKKLHNEVDTNTTIDEGGAFWAGAFALSDLSLDVNHQMNIGPNQASIRYVEVVNLTTGAEFGLLPSTDYPFGQSFLQHEHALVTVDDDCKMTLWDQYGDNLEQTQVDDAVAALLSEPSVQCVLGMLTPEECANLPDKTDPPMDTTSSSNRVMTVTRGLLLFSAICTYGSVMLSL